MALFTKIVPSLTAAAKKKSLFFDSIFIDMDGCTAIDNDPHPTTANDDDHLIPVGSNSNKEPRDSILIFSKDSNKLESIKGRNEKSMTDYKRIADSEQTDGTMTTSSSSHTRNDKENSSSTSNFFVSDIISHANLIRRSATGALILEPRSTIDERFMTSRFATTLSGTISTTSATSETVSNNYENDDTAIHKDGYDDGNDDGIDATESYIEVLFSRVRHNHIQYVLHALEQGFDINAVDQNGNSIVHICAQNNHRKLMHAIISKHPWVDINRRNKKHCTALDYCEKYGFLKMYDWLVVEGAFHGRELATIAPKRYQNHLR